MSYAIIRNEKLTRAQAMGAYKHNERKTKNHSNKNIDSSKTELNYYLKKNELSYIKEFDKTKEKYDLKGQIRSNSIIICEMIFTSDADFFNKIGQQETKRYFNESYKFICNYKNLGEKYIISAVVHLDEGTPHMHLIYVPVIHTKDKVGNEIDKVCSRDFWKGRDSYRNLQNDFYEYITSKGFELKRGLPSQETGRKHETIQDFKQITNFENTKKVLENITLELPNVPKISDIKKVMLNRDEKIVERIVKPKDDLILELHKENLVLNRELSKQANLVDIASRLEKEQVKMLENNVNLKYKCRMLEEKIEDKEREFEIRLKNKTNEIENKYIKEIKNLKSENKTLYNMIDKFKINFKKFIKWICKKFSYPSEDEIIRDFHKETYINIEKQLNINEFKKKENSFDRDLYL